MQQLFKVQGMSCQHCVRAVEDALLDLDPEAQVQVDLAAGQVSVQSAQPRESLSAAIAEAGYTVQSSAS